MLQLRKSFTYVENMTITGKKLIAGDRDSNTYIHVKKNMANSFAELVKMISSGAVANIESLDNEYRPLAVQMDAKGFFETSEKPKGSFNELNSFARVIYKREFSSGPMDKKNRYFSVALLLSALVAMTIFVLLNRNYLDRQLDTSSLSLTTILVGALVIPVFIYLIHEVGHYVSAKLLGVPVASLQIGFFITYPVIYLTYRGLNLNTTLKKVCILLGGVAGHTAGLVIGIILMKCYINNILLDVWMLGNVSMIFVNLSVFGVTDGYYIATSLLGIYNLRLLGYSALQKAMHRQKPDKRETACGIGLLALWVLSFFGVYNSIMINASYFNIPQDIVTAICVIFILLLTIRFIYKAYKVKL